MANKPRISNMDIGAKCDMKYPVAYLQHRRELLSGDI